MITAYHRPQTLDEDLTLLTQPNILPLGGGTLLSKPTTDSVEVADLQALGLDTVKKNGNNLELGATLTLQTLLESEHCPPALKSALKLEAPLNIRNSATVAGTLIAADGRSTFASVLLAMDTKIIVSSKQSSVFANCLLTTANCLLSTAKGFSTNTCFPAFNAFTTKSA